MSNYKYGIILNRVKAVTVDGVVLAGLGVTTSYIFSKFEYLPEWLRLVAFIIIFLLYDPIFTSFFGCTVGHLVTGLRVRRVSNETKKISFPLALLRFIIKALLGWISLLTVSSNEKKNAIHDLAVGSVVIQVD